VRCQIQFDCPQLPPLTQPAKTVHELRPQDIKVVTALGDSITAGTCMYSKHDLIPQTWPFLDLYICSVLLFLCSGFGMMGAHRDIAEDLNEYRVLTLISDIFFTIDL
jgi:hypothetical protein